MLQPALLLRQAMPGPLFNFSAYLGAIIAWNRGYAFIVGTVVAWFGLFGPGVMLMFAVLPFWKRFREWQVYRRALPGAPISLTGCRYHACLHASASCGLRACCSAW